MHKRFLVFITLIIVNTSLWAMDLNETTTIINEAQEATLTLQDEFNTIVNEVPTPIETELSEVNTSIQTVQASEIIEVNSSILEQKEEAIKTLDSNQSNEKNTSVLIKKPIMLINPLETNQTNDSNKTIVIDEPLNIVPLMEVNGTIINDTNKSFCQEQNISNDNNESNNSDEPDNGCTDIQGDSMQGLIIFKTRIKPYCEISGESFAKQYMQEDWDDIFHEKEFKMEILKACPKMKDRYKNKWTPHLYQFCFDYASDSDAIPEC